MGSQVYPRKPKPAPATNVIMETLLFCDGNRLQSTWTPNCGCNGTDTCGQHWGQDVTGKLYQQVLHPKTTLT